MDNKRKISLAASIFIAIVLLLPGLGLAGSLNPPPNAVDESGNPVPTTLPKFACRGAFIYNWDGTVTDCKTGMIWMRNANCFGAKKWGDDAFSSCALLEGGGSCGLFDGSSAGDWRLPTIEELKTLPDRAYSYPALSNAKGDAQWTEGDAFTSVQSSHYWSSTTDAHNPSNAWIMYMPDGDVGSMLKTNENYIWCVRKAN